MCDPFPLPKIIQGVLYYSSPTNTLSKHLESQRNMSE